MYEYKGKISLQDCSRWIASNLMIGFTKQVDQELIVEELELISGPPDAVEVREEGDTAVWQGADNGQSPE